MLFLLISRVLIYTFLLLSIIVAFYNSFGATDLLSGRFHLLGRLQLLGFSLLF